MHSKTRFSGGFAAVVACVVAFVLLAIMAPSAKLAWAQASQAKSDDPTALGVGARMELGAAEARGLGTQAASIAEVRAMIEALPAASDVVKADGERIAQARAAFDALSAAEQQLLDTETNRTALHTTQSYGRVLELAEAGYAVLFEVDNGTTLADGVYTSNLATEWDRGKSASKQDRDWVAKRVVVRDGKAYVTLGINSSTYSYLRASGTTVARLASSGANESLFTFPVTLNAPMVFCSYSELMAAEIAYNLKVSLPDGASPDAQLGEGEEGEGEGGELAPAVVDPVACAADPITGAVVAEAGTFEHPEVKSQISTMFRIVAPALVTSDGHAMTVYAEMPSTSYTHLFVGTAEEAAGKTLEAGVADGTFVAASDITNSEGKEASAFTFPLASLDKDFAICLYSKNNKHWVDHVIRFNSVDLIWHLSDEEAAQLQAALEKLEALPARNTIVPDNAEHEATVRAARDAYDALNSHQKARVPARLTLLLDWDTSMFELGFNTDHLPLALVGQSYDGAVYVSGKNATAGKTARVVDGALPEGLSIEVDAEGRWAYFEGTPRKVGSSMFTVELSNGVETVRKQFTIHVGYAPRILTETVADALSGFEYEQVFEADAYPDAMWTLAAGKLPAGLSLVDDGPGANTARIKGTPTETGSFTFTLACDNFANGVEKATYTMQVSFGGAAKQVAALADLIAAAQAELDRLKAENSQMKGEIGTLKASNAQTKSDVDKLKTANGKLSSQVKGLKKSVAKLQKLQPKKVVVNVKTVTAKAVKAALKKARNPYATSITLGAKVKTIKKRAFASTDVRTITIKSTKLVKKRVKGALAGSKVKMLKVPKTKKAAYKKAFAKANSGKKVAVK